MTALMPTAVIGTLGYWLTHYNSYPSLGELLRALGGSV